MSSTQLAVKTKTDERYLREWLASQAAGYVTYDEKTAKFSLTEELVFTLATEDSPAYLPGAFELALGSLAAVPQSPNPSALEPAWVGTNTWRASSTVVKSSLVQVMPPIW
jgi:hypothetical protein